MRLFITKFNTKSGHSEEKRVRFQSRKPIPLGDRDTLNQQIKTRKRVLFLVVTVSQVELLWSAAPSILSNENPVVCSMVVHEVERYLKAVLDLFAQRHNGVHLPSQQGGAK